MARQFDRPWAYKLQKRKFLALGDIRILQGMCVVPRKKRGFDVYNPSTAVVGLQGAELVAQNSAQHFFFQEPALQMCVCVCIRLFLLLLRRKNRDALSKILELTWPDCR